MAQASHARVWSFDIQRGPDWLIVRPHRSGSGPRVADWAEQVWQLMEQNFTQRLVLECGTLERLDAHGIGQLVWLHDRIQSADGMMRLCGLTPENQMLLAEAKLAGRFPGFRDRTAAIMGQPHE